MSIPSIDERLAADLKVFRALVREPTHEQWEALAMRLAVGMWREGYMHGQLAAVRYDDPETLERIEQERQAAAVRGEVVAQALRRAQPGQLTAIPLDEAHAQLFDAQGFQSGGWRVVVDDPEEP